MTNKKFQKKSVRKFGSMVTSKNVNPFTGAKQHKTLGGYMVTINPETSGERASKPKRSRDRFITPVRRLLEKDKAENKIETARKKRLAKKKAKKLKSK
tara:strand:+ start:1656 stop:1949 length:294 start_codon:yes stop_codon:yes gene_type:complete